MYPVSEPGFNSAVGEAPSATQGVLYARSSPLSEAYDSQDCFGSLFSPVAFPSIVVAVGRSVLNLRYGADACFIELFGLSVLFDSASAVTKTNQLFNHCQEKSYTCCLS